MPTLEFTMMVGCPLMCTFCPQDRIRGEYRGGVKYMTLDNFKHILAKVPPHVRIDFSGMAEPWSAPDCTAMLRHCLETGYSMAVYTTLYGMEDGAVVADLLTRHAAQVEVLCLHLPDASGNMRGWRHSPVYEATLKSMLDLGAGPLRGRFQAMTMSGNGDVHPDLAATIGRLGAWQALSRAGNVDTSETSGATMTGVPRHATAVSCSFTPFYDQNVVLPDGSVYLCCMDYGLKHKIGNLLQDDYYTMFGSSEGLADLMGENMNPQFSDRSLCKTCERARTHHVGASRQNWY